MSLNGAIYDHETGTYTVTRTTDGGYDSKGRRQPGATSTFTIRASCQPASAEDLKDLPEGQSTAGTYLVLTETKLETRADNPNVAPDVIEIRGRKYRIESGEWFEHWGEQHGEYIAVKLDTA